MSNVVLYGHNGSGNHGCEALVRSTVGVLHNADADDITLISTKPEQDRKYIADIGLNIELLGSEFTGMTAKRLLAKASYLFAHSLRRYDKQEMRALFSVRDSLCISIGGDNYCYDDFDRYARMNKYLKENNNKTVLWGCSISPDLIANPAVMDDLKMYDLITARESITYDNLINAGLGNVKYVPDTAFLLPVETAPIPFKAEKVIGINLSPLVIEREKSPGVVRKSFENLIDYILDNTDCEIALIPHVHNEYSEDFDALMPLYEKYRDSGRVYLIDEEKTMNCCQLKYIISKLSLLITARTHASIAAYSTGVPTLVIGYSVKSKGIAKDIFGEHEKYVCSVECMKSGEELKERFQWVIENATSLSKLESLYTNNALSDFSSLHDIIKSLL